METTTVRVSTDTRDKLRQVRREMGDGALDLPSMDQVIDALVDRWRAAEAARRPA